MTHTTLPTHDTPSPMGADDFDTLDAILDDIRTREPETAQWDFFEGVLAAIVCCRDPISDEDAFGWLFPQFEDEVPLFADAAQETQFLALWQRRRAEIASSLLTEVDALSDDRAFSPEVMDTAGALLALPEEERQAWYEAQGDGHLVPSYAQVWAMGFMAAVEMWDASWATPRDPDIAAWFDESMDKITALTEDDNHPPIVNLFDDDALPSVSQERMNAFGLALWAVYDLHQIARSLGPRIGPIVKGNKPGRNDLCWCGSGKKFKKCHGA
ncbi:MAG: hypothetical protein RLZZ612_2223 [Pseudomonadota bacterium]|jgi:uncharacterized protein